MAANKKNSLNWEVSKNGWNWEISSKLTQANNKFFANGFFFDLEINTLEINPINARNIRIPGIPNSADISSIILWLLVPAVKPLVSKIPVEEYSYPISWKRFKPTPKTGEREIRFTASFAN